MAARATQTALEAWIIPPRSLATQVVLEGWTQQAGDPPRVTQVVLEAWTQQDGGAGGQSPGQWGFWNYWGTE